jgi:hypothetical protein
MPKKTPIECTGYINDLKGRIAKLEESAPTLQDPDSAVCLVDFRGLVQEMQIIASKSRDIPGLWKEAIHAVDEELTDKKSILTASMLELILSTAQAIDNTMLNIIFSEIGGLYRNVYVSNDASSGIHPLIRLLSKGYENGLFSKVGLLINIGRLEVGTSKSLADMSPVWRELIQALA